jgi:hypothetical protein
MIWLAPESTMPRTGPRVVCALWVTMETLAPTSALVSVDLPLFGAPMMATNPQREETPGASAIDGSLPDSLAQEHGERCRLLSRALILPLPALGRHTVDLHLYREEGHMIGTFAGDFEIARKSKPPSLRPFL